MRARGAGRSCVVGKQAIETGTRSGPTLKAQGAKDRYALEVGRPLGLGAVDSLSLANRAIAMELPNDNSKRSRVRVVRKLDFSRTG